MMSQIQAAAAQNASNREKLERMRVKRNSELELNLTNMLIHLYNGKPCNDFIKEYKTILDNVIQLIRSHPLFSSHGLRRTSALRPLSS